MNFAASPKPKLLLLALVGFFILFASFLRQSGYSPNDFNGLDTGCRNWDLVSPPNTKSKICFHLIGTLKQKGFAAALKEFTQLYKSDRSFEIGDCHMYAHSIGRVSHILGEPLVPEEILKLPKQIAECAAKTYHGYFQEFLLNVPRDRDLLKDASVICKNVESKERASRADTNSNLAVHCALGVGYGLTFSYATQYGQKEEMIVERGIPDCRQLAISFGTNNSYFNNCVDGLYEGITMLYLGRASDKLSFNPPKADPFGICKRQEGVIKMSCYLLLKAFVFSTNPDLKTTADYLSDTEKEISYPIIEDLSKITASYLIRNKKSIEEIAAECRKLDVKFQNICIGAMAYRIAKFESPKDALRFCRSGTVLNDEQENCFLKLVDSLHQNYTSQERRWICPLLPIPYRSACEK